MRLTDFQAIIVDLDGTLYYQKPVRRAMLWEMARRFWRIRDYLIVKKYRNLYEQGLGDGERLARLSSDSPLIIREWMLERPLPYVARYRDGALIDLLERAMTAKVTVIVCSDYPVAEKLGALRFAPDRACSADDMGCMKPDASGLLCILAELHIPPAACLVIGDRHEKDGALADNLGAQSLILPSSRRARMALYGQIHI